MLYRTIIFFGFFLSKEESKKIIEISNKYESNDDIYLAHYNYNGFKFIILPHITNNDMDPTVYSLCIKILHKFNTNIFQISNISFRFKGNENDDKLITELLDKCNIEQKSIELLMYNM